MPLRASADAIRTEKLQFWFVYILKLSNGKFYTGYTQNIDERLFRHKNGMGYKSIHSLECKKSAGLNIAVRCTFYGPYTCIKLQIFRGSAAMLFTVEPAVQE